ncbi:MAG: peptide deformylase [Calditrichia bacterium]
MSVLNIIKIGHPTLRKVAKPVEKFDRIGLAAPQVNVSKRLFVIDKKLINEEWEAEAYINPKIIKADGSNILEEGCLSIPNIRADVDRPFKIEAEYQTLKGEKVREEMDDLLARVFQHEFDHLEGVLFVDKISILKKKLLEPQLKEIEQIYTY